MAPNVSYARSCQTTFSVGVVPPEPPPSTGLNSSLAPSEQAQDTARRQMMGTKARNWVCFIGFIG